MPIYDGAPDLVYVGVISYHLFQEEDDNDSKNPFGLGPRPSSHFYLVGVFASRHRAVECVRSDAELLDATPLIRVVEGQVFEVEFDVYKPYQKGDRT